MPNKSSRFASEDASDFVFTNEPVPQAEDGDAGLLAVLDALTSGDPAEDGTPGEEALDHAAAILEYLHDGEPPSRPV